MLTTLESSFKYNDADRKFALPGLLSANKDMGLAFKNLRSPLKNQGAFVKVMLRIKIDKKSDEKKERTRTTCIVLNDKLSHTPNDL